MAPVHAPIIEVFREPPCRWCAGKRGVVYATDPDATVRAGASGTVWFAGPVGGVNYVVVRTIDGVLVTHGLLSQAFVHTGDAVHVGEPVGEVSGRLYFGVRIDGRYIDPLRCMASGPTLVKRAILVPAPLRNSASGTP
ncbi:MAG: peptidoglycan DD-metalloendopeptidase family protein [Ilumatobacteraceae bacterium]